YARLPQLSGKISTPNRPEHRNRVQLQKSKASVAVSFAAGVTEQWNSAPSMAATIGFAPCVLSAGQIAIQNTLDNRMELFIQLNNKVYGADARLSQRKR